MDDVRDHFKFNYRLEVVKMTDKLYYGLKKDTNKMKNISFCGNTDSIGKRGDGFISV